jgi:hypothetical protein
LVVEGWRILSFRQSKTGQHVHIRAPRPLREELVKTEREGSHILTNRQRQPYTRDGLQANF